MNRATEVKAVIVRREHIFSVDEDAILAIQVWKRYDRVVAMPSLLRSAQVNTLAGAAHEKRDRFGWA